LKTSTSSYLPPPVACERLDALLARFGGSYLDSKNVVNESGATSAANRVAQLPDGRVFGSGTVLAPDGSSVAIDVSTDFGGPADSHWLLGYTQIRPPVRIAGATAVVAVNLGTRYCHWLLEELPRLLALERSAGTGIIVSQRAPFIREAFDLGRFSGPILAVGRHTHFECEQLLIPPLTGRAGDPSPLGVKRVHEFTAPWRGTASVFGEKIYVSRENAGRRRVLNDAELWPQLEARGFTKLRLEELSWRDQINAFAHAREVVAPHGAGLTNLVFSPADTRVVEFFHRAYVNPCFGRLAELRNLDYHAVIPAGPDAIRHEPRGNRLDLHADVTAILAALRTN
jgi:capsular polysaccharide biosynthesis protein